MSGFILAIPVVALLGPGAVNIAIAVAVSSVSVLGRLSRGSTLSVRKQGHVIVARSMGASAPRIVVQHNFPNIVAPILIRSSLNLATAVLSAAGLSFLGLGSQPPALEWGLMLSTAGGHIISSLGISPLPRGCPSLLAAMSFNVVGGGLRDALDPRLKKRQVVSRTSGSNPDKATKGKRGVGSTPRFPFHARRFYQPVRWAFSIFAHSSFSDTARLKTNLPLAASGSRQK